MRRLSNAGREKSVRSTTTRGLLALAALLLAAASPAAAQVGETYYIPLPSTQVKVWADTQTNLAENDTLRVEIGITVTAADAVIYWDHWEDGFEFEITDPVNPGTGLGAEIWGDGDCANGYRPDLVGGCSDAADSFSAGDVLTLQSDVPVPGDPAVRNPAQIRFDGGDKLFSTELLAVTYASWPSAGIQAQLGDAVEVARTEKWGSSFASPVGTNVPTGVAAFEFSALSILARENGTQVAVDADGPGAGGSVTYALDEGESVLVQGIQVGATVAASAANGTGERTVQVVVLTANNGSTYEGRWFNLPPTTAWDDSYWAPAGSTGGSPTVVFVHNKDATALDVTFERLVGGAFTSSTQSIAARSTFAFTLPTATPPSAAHFLAARPFYAVSATALASTLYDWGYALVPETSLTPAAVVGWAPGTTTAALIPDNAAPGDLAVSRLVVEDAVALTDVNVALFIDHDYVGDLRVRLRSPSGTTRVLFNRPTNGGGGCGDNNLGTATTPLTFDDESSLGTVNTRCSGTDPWNGANASIRPVETLSAFDGQSSLGTWALLVEDYAGNSLGHLISWDLVTTPVVTRKRLLPAEVANPVWVTPVLTGAGATTIYVDFDGDPATGPNVDPNGGRYDVAYPASRLQAIRVAETGLGRTCDDTGGDCDLTGARLYTTDGTKIAAAWGQDVSLGISGSPQQLDMGTTVIPFSSLNAFKDGALLVDNNGNGGIDVGDTILYTTIVRNTGIIPVAEVFVTDTLDSGTEYVAGTFEVDGLPVADDSSPFTPFPLDPSPGSPNAQGFVLVFSGGSPPAPPIYSTPLTPGGEIVLTYQVRVLSTATDPIVNTVTVTSDTETYVDTSNNPIPAGALQIAKTSSLAGDNAIPGEPITYTVTVTNPAASPGAVTGVRITDGLPVGTTYVAQSTSVTGPRQLYVADRFGTAAASPNYANDNGPNSWADGADVGTAPDPWVETDETGGSNAAAGDFQVIIGPGGGELQLNGDSDGAAPGPTVTRLVDFSSYSGAGALRAVAFDFSAPNNTDVNITEDAVNLQCDADGVDPFTTLGTINWLDGAAGPLLSGRAAFEVPTTCAGASTRIRFTVTSTTQAGDFFRIDDVEVRGVGDRQNPASDNFSSGWPLSGIGWLGPWSFTGTNVDIFAVGGNNRLRLRGGAVQPVVTRAVDLSSVSGRRPVLAILSLDVTSAADLEVDDFLHVEASKDGVGFTTLASFADDSSGTRSFDLSSFLSSTTTIRFRGQSLDSTGDTFYIDNVSIVTGAQTSVTKDNVPAGTNADLADGVPSSITLPTDSFALAPGESVTATFQVLVNDPVAVSRIVNIALGSAFEPSQRVQATVIDPVSPGGRIGDRVWLDVDGDGVQDIGEPGLSGVTVELRDGTCELAGPPVCPTAVTDLNGNYLFSGLKPDTYTVVVLSGVPSGLSPSPYPPVSTVTITNGDEVFDQVDFGYVPASGSAVIGDRVWADADGDGIQDPGEIGIGGVTVTLYSAGADGIFDVIAGSTTTDADGTYLFTNVLPGQYAVAVSGAPLGGRTPTTGPQSIGALVSPPVSVIANQTLNDVDFGFNAPGTFTVSDTFWVDEDQDGIYDPTERPIAGVTVNLVDSLGNVVGTATSGADGTFDFSGVPNGSYTIVVTDTAGVLAGRERTTSFAAAGERDITVSGADFSGESFGYAQPGLIGDRIWSDSDGDGVQDPGEAGLSGITVNLLGPGPDGLLFTADDAVVGTTTTAADGSYEFANLPPGGYRVQVPAAQPALSGYTQTGDPNVPNAPCGAACDSQGSSTVTLGSTDRNLDFGFRDTTRPDISGTVFEDGDLDGVEDAGEGGIAGVEVALVAAGTDGIFGTADDVVVATTFTDANGDYLFRDVQDGSYRVEVRDGAGVLDGYRLTSGRDQIPVTVAGVDVADVDFGYARGTATGAIGDTLFLDVAPPLAGNPPPDGLPGPTEPRLPGVTVRLYEDTDGDGVRSAGDTLVATTVTDANGEYLFTGLPPGSYLVDPDETTLPHTTPGDLVETTYQPGLNPSRVINLADGQRFDRADFGYVPRANTVVLGDFVWYDADGNGLADPGEVGIPGIDILLFGAGPDEIFGTADDTSFTTTTGPDGTYLFTGLPPDDYYLSYEEADILALGLVNDPTNTGPGQTTYSFTATAGDVISTLDFGFDGGTFGSIGDRIWLDVDGDGVQDAGEQGLGGVTVNLLDSTGTVILATTTTDANGNYDFVGLPAGSYRVDVTDIDGVLAALNPSATNPTGAIALAAGQDYNLADFGYVPSGGSGTIGTSIWHDLDADGVRDPLEPPIEGVTVDLFFDTNGDGDFDPGVDNRIRTVTTDANGEFEHLGLPSGTYFVRVTDTAGVLAGFTKTTGPNPGQDDNSQANPYRVDLTPGSPSNVTADFGYQDDQGGPLSISGTVFLDANVSGIYEPGAPQLEQPVQSAVLRLYRIVDTGPQLVGITTANAFGFYTFGDLPPGEYEVRVDVTSTAADGFLQTTQTTTGGVQPVTLTLVGGNSTGNDFGFYDGGITTTPVTLAAFAAEGDEGYLTARWTTATEVGHVGFHLWVWRDGAWHRLNEELIPGGEGDSLDLRRYEVAFARPGGRSLLLEEIDVLGISRYHGPFLAGERYGHEELVQEPIDWAKIAREHETKAAGRAALQRQELLRSPSPALLMKTGTAGVFRATYEQLAAAGLDLLGADPDAIAVTWRGSAVPVRVEASGPFGPGAFVEWLAAGIDTLYTGTDVYRISVAPELALRVPEEPAVAGGAVATSYREPMRIERQRRYDFGSPTGDPWYDTAILAYGSPAAASFPFVTEGRLPGEVALTVDLVGVTNWELAPDHRALVRVNGTQVGDELVFDGRETASLAVAVPESYLLPGTNSLEVVLPGDTGAEFDIVNVDGFTVDYPRHLVARDGRLEFTAAAPAFEVAGFASNAIEVYREAGGAVERLTGVQVVGVPGDYRARFPGTASPARYVVTAEAAIRIPALAPARPPAGLLEGQGELLVISHPDFLDGLAPLLARRSAQGWAVKLVDVEDVYAEFGGDRFDPAAIRAYIGRAVDELGTRAVLLVGGDSYDYRNYLGLGSLSFVPSLYAPTGDIVRYAPADSLFADLDGDSVPDVAIGRFPVRTSADLDALVEKTLAYEDENDRRSLVLVADGYDAPTRFSFSQVSDQLASLVPGGWQVDRIDLDLAAPAAARAELLARMDAGPAVLSYMGHSGPTLWTFDGLFNSADAAGLANFGLPTVAMQWGCWTTYYVEPANNTLAHRLLLSGDRGAAAVLGASTLSEARSERAMSLEVFRRAFQSGTSLGEAVLGAKRSLVASGNPAVLDVLLGWNLLGDPTLGLGTTDGAGGDLVTDGFESGGFTAWSAVR